MADRYFDLNGSTAGFGTLTNSWNTTAAFWSTSSAGTAVPGTFTFTSADRAFFGAAGATATAGSATIIDGLTVTLNNITTANLAGLQTIARNTTGALTLAGTTPSITVNSAGGLRIIAPIGGSTAWTANGTGTLTLGSAIISNTFSGGMTVASGVVQVGNASALGTGTVTITGGKLSSSDTTGYTLANALSLNGTMTLGDATNNGALTFSGATTIAGTTVLTVATNNIVTFSGTLGTTANSLSKGGSGDLYFSGPSNSYTGPVTITSNRILVGTFGATACNQLANASSITLNAGTGVWYIGNTDTTLSTPHSGTGDVVVYKNGTLTFSGTALAGLNAPGFLYQYRDGSDPTAQTVLINAAGAFPSSANIKFGSFASVATSLSLKYTGASNVSNTGAIQVISTTNNSVVTLDNSGTGGSTVTFSGNVPNLTGSAVTTILTLTGTSTGALTLSGNITDASGSVTNISKTGTVPVTLSGANTFTGSVTVSAGTLNANSATALGAASSTAAISVLSGATLSLAANATMTYSSRNLSISGDGTSFFVGSLVLSDANTYTFGSISIASNNTFIRSTANATLAGNITNGGNLIILGSGGTGAAATTTLTVNGVISGTGGLAFGNSSFDVLGTVILSGTNSYQGNTTFGSGTVRANNNSAFGTGTLVFTGGAIDTSAPRSFSNAVTVSSNITFAGTAALTLSSNIALGANRIVTTNGSGGALTLSGIVSGSTFKLTKAGTNTLKLTGANTYSGGTDITTGVVQAGNTQALGTTGTVTLSAGAVLQTLTASGQNGKLTVAALNNSAGGTIRIGG